MDPPKVPSATDERETPLAATRRETTLTPRGEIPGSTKQALSDQQLQRLKDGAVQAKTYAYCPYSEFRVGAAFLTNEGHFITGANIENASFGVGTCAERVALGTAVVSASIPLGGTHPLEDTLVMMLRLRTYTYGRSTDRGTSIL
ncbi:MAG: hypothetical protein Q9216_002528 [Gyalolechia sp. 2 TL-2023]